MDIKNSGDPFAGNSVDELLANIQGGANAGAAKQWMDDYVYLKIWKIITLIANLPASENGTTLIDLKAMLKAHILIAQELSLDIASAEHATKRLRETYDRTYKGGNVK